MFIASLYCLFAAGVVFGFAAFKPVLVAEGVYSEYCTDGDPGSDATTCYGQELRLNLMFTIAAVATNVCALPVGTILDQYGPRVSSIIGSILLAVGSGFLIGAPHAKFDCYIPGYLFLALGGPFIFISSFQLSNCFPRHSGLILALLTGAFDTSSAVFLVYRLIYEHTDRAFKPENFFTIYLIVPVFILIMQFVVMPKESYKTVGELVKEAESPAYDTLPADSDRLDSTTRQNILDEQRRERRDSVLAEIEPLLAPKDADKQAKDEEHKKHVSGVWGALHGRSALQQIRTPWFILITLFTVVQMTRINYFVATIRTQYTEIFHSEKDAALVNQVFDIALPIGGVVSVPFIGLLLDNLSTPITLTVLTVVATAIGVFGVLPFMWAAYLNVLLFVLYRPLYYTAVSDYSAKVFGFHTFGKVYGLIICIAGLLNFSQSGLDALTHTAFRDDPVPVNVALLLLLAMIGIVLVTYVWRKSLTLERDELEEEAEASEERERLMPGATDRPGRDTPAGYGTNGHANGGRQ